MFNTKPIFSPMGTCFTTSKELVETEANTFRSIRLWLSMIHEQTPGRNIFL